MSNFGEVYWCDVRNDRATPSFSSDADLFQGWNILRTNAISELHASLRGQSTSAQRLIVVELDFPDTSLLEPLKELRKSNFQIPTVLAGSNQANWLRTWAKGARVWNVVTQASELIETLAWFTDIRRLDMNILHPTPSRNDVSLCDALPTTRFVREIGRTDAAVEHVQQHYSENISVDEAARLCGMSLRQFANAFRKEHVVGFREFVVRYRIERAKQMLGDTRIAVKEVAYCVGFNDTANFCKVFRLYVGSTAAEFRDALATGGRVPLAPRVALFGFAERRNQNWGANRENIGFNVFSRAALEEYGERRRK